MRLARSVIAISAILAGSTLASSGCGGDAATDSSTPAPAPNVAAAVILLKSNGSQTSAIPVIINAVGKVLSRPAVTPASALAYDGAGVLWIAKGVSVYGPGTEDMVRPGCNIWRTDPARQVLTHQQARSAAVKKGLAKQSDSTLNFLCGLSITSSGGVAFRWGNTPSGVEVSLPRDAQSAAQVSVVRAPVDTTDYADGIPYPTWDGATLRVAPLESWTASSVTLDRKDGTSQVLWTEGVGLHVTKVAISRDGKWLFALVGNECGACESDLYRAAIAEGPAGATATGGPRLVLKRVVTFTVPPPTAGQSVLPLGTGTDTTGADSTDTAAPAPIDLLVSGPDLPADYSDMGEAVSADGLSSDFYSPGDPCWPAFSSYRVERSAAQVLSGPGWNASALIASTVVIMDMNTREDAARALSGIRDSGRACGTDSSGRVELVGGIAPMISWNSSTTVDGDYTTVSTGLAQPPGTRQIISHGGLTVFTQGPYLVKINASNMAADISKVTDPLSLEPEIEDILSTIASAQKSKIREATGNRAS